MRHMARRFAVLLVAFTAMKAWALPTFDDVKASYRPSTSSSWIAMAHPCKPCAWTCVSADCLG